MAGITKKAAKYKNKSIGVIPFYFFFLILVNLSIEVNPNDPNANNATASTKYSAGLISPCVNVFAIKEVTSANTHSNPPNLLDE
jgi:hypothetical protein